MSRLKKEDDSRRKPNGEGSVFQRADGRWVAQFSLGDGKKRQLSRKTEKEAWSALRKALNEVEQGVMVTGPEQTLSAFLHHWLEEIHKPTLRLSSYIKYQKLIKTYIIPELGHLKLQKLSPQLVQAFYRRKEKQGLAPKTVNSIHGVLHKALDTAVRWNMLARNVCDVVSPPRIIKHEIQSLTMEQAQQLLAVAHGDRLEMLLLLALVTGMRRGELLGLKWADIDLIQGALQIRRTLDYMAHYGYVESEPKTKSGKRGIMLPSFVVEALKQHRIQQLEQRLKVGEAWQEGDYVFTSLEGGPLNPRYLLKLFDQLLERAGLPHMRFHDLRHSAATLLLSMGVNPKIVQEILGHSTISMTMDVYSHVLPSMQREAMGKWDDALGSV
ncbi:MAG TPA: tyrosine-type recombinase/integrase [Ktedonobacteraceae bacterium]|nr:tyrosine-type recombinase/integrase [Ktedonobacteraceae bacterium]